MPAIFGNQSPSQLVITMTIRLSTSLNWGRTLT